MCLYFYILLLLLSVQALCPDWENDKAVLSWAEEDPASLKAYLAGISRYPARFLFVPVEQSKASPLTAKHSVARWLRGGSMPANVDATSLPGVFGFLDGGVDSAG